ncbi:MAG: hydrogenase expression/formation protein HypE [Elusimicrobiaceae bacterium]|nr:hydrogenase expression/formation protein HypE [Elusimicrobiaceae bacterium]
MKKITMSHGSGGAGTDRLIAETILKHFTGPVLARLEDSAELPPPGGRLAFTTDSYVVSPRVFPGGDIGHIAVCGTVNDLAVKGAVPKWISVALILEEGLEIEELENTLASMQKTALKAGVEIVTGDTKVVEKGKADGMFITASGIGVIPDGVRLSAAGIRPGDRIIISGPLAEHGVAVLNARHRLGLKSGIKSDGAPLNGLTAAILKEHAPFIRVMRDLTRGGLAGALNELAAACGRDFSMEERLIPVSDAVRAACAILGTDPLAMANEGRLCLFCSADRAERVLAVMRDTEFGGGAAIAGTVTEGKTGRVLLATAIGAERILSSPEGEVLPRIC